jgi:hypothetical protein
VIRSNPARLIWWGRGRVRNQEPVTAARRMTTTTANFFLITDSGEWRGEHHRPVYP